MVVSVLRPRIERLLYGDEFVSDDLSRLFLYLRETSYGRQTVREVGDFVAHFGMRDKGPTTQLATNFFTVLRFFTPLLAHPEHLHGLSVNPDVLEANFATIDQETLRQKTKLKPRIAKQVFNSMIAKMRQIAGKNESRTLDQNEAILFRFLLTHFTSRPAFDDEILFKEFSAVLEKNKLVHENERDALKRIKPIVSLYAVALMHLCHVKLKDGAPAELMADRHNAEGAITVIATGTCPTKEIPNLRFAGSMFNTSLSAKDWCEPELLEGDSQTKWTFPIELGANKKLRRMKDYQSPAPWRQLVPERSSIDSRQEQIRAYPFLKKYYAVKGK